MPFLGFEKWEEHLYEPYRDLDVEIPCDDLEAYRLNPSLRYLYYKPIVLDIIGVYNAPSGSPVDRYPLIQKPVFNPWGMGMGVRVFDSDYDEDRDYVPGHFLMEKWEGEHKSIDMLVRDGEILFHQSTIGHPGPDQTFDYWELVQDKLLISDAIQTLIFNTRFTGCVNLELISGNMVEICLRHSGQFVDMYDTQFLDNLVKLNTGNNITQMKQVSGRYSVPVFVDELCDEAIKIEHPMLIKTVDPDCNPRGGMRLGYINTTNLKEAMEARREILNVVNNH